MKNGKLLPSVDILTPELKAKIDALGDGEILEFRIIPSSEDVTMEQMQESALKFMKGLKDGTYKPRPIFEIEALTQKL